MMQHGNTNMKWEYTSQTASSVAELMSLLNGFGDQGWELITITVTNEPAIETRAIFKRPKQGSPAFAAF